LEAELLVKFLKVKSWLITVLVEKKKTGEFFAAKVVSLLP